MNFSVPTTLSVGQSLQTLFFSAARFTPVVPARDLRIGLSQALWSEGSSTARNLALRLARAGDAVSYTHVASTLNDHFVRGTDLANSLTREASLKAQTNEDFARSLSEAARAGYEKVVKPHRRERRGILPHYFNAKRPESDEEVPNLWEASLARLVNPKPKN